MTSSNSEELRELNNEALSLESESTRLTKEIFRSEAEFVIREQLSLEGSQWPEQIRMAYEAETARVRSFVRLDGAELLKIINEFELEKYSVLPMLPEELLQSWDLRLISARLGYLIEFGNFVDHVELLRAELNLKLAIGRRDPDVEPSAPSFWEVVGELALYFKRAQEAAAEKVLHSFISDYKLWDSAAWSDETWDALHTETSEQRSRLREIERKLKTTYERIRAASPGGESIAIVCTRGAEVGPDPNR